MWSINNNAYNIDIIGYTPVWRFGPGRARIGPQNLSWFLGSDERMDVRPDSSEKYPLKIELQTEGFKFSSDK